MSAYAHQHTVAAAAFTLGLVLTGCEGRQSALNPAGPQSDLIAGLFWLFTGLGAVVYAAVVLMLLAGVFRRRRARVRDQTPATKPSPSAEHRLRNAVLGAVAVSVLILLTLIISDFLTGRRIYAVPSDEPLTIRVTGHQWWWEIRYEDPRPSRIVTTANEIHVPVGRPVRFELTSNDVIHSFWIPNLNGKKDLVPGYESSTWFTAEEPGTYVGQCAEFCGHQHARMRILLVAEPEAAFQAWLDAQRAPARRPRTPRQLRGQEVFLTSTCVMCHRIQGTPAGATLGPDLTHVGSRRTLAAASIPNTRGQLAAWIVDPQHIKPGARMPPNILPSQDLQALLDYLQSLK